jgi:hypothetical protein
LQFYFLLWLKNIYNFKINPEPQQLLLTISQFFSTIFFYINAKNLGKNLMQKFTSSVKIYEKI